MQCGLPLKHTWSVSDLWGQGPFIILWLTLHFMLAFWADLCRSGVKANLCGFWLLQPFPPTFWVCALVSMGSGEHFTLNSFSVTVPVGGCMQKWFPFAGLLWIPVADLEKMRGGGGGLQKNFFWPFAWIRHWIPPCYEWGPQAPVQPLRNQFPSSSLLAMSLTDKCINVFAKVQNNL